LQEWAAPDDAALFVHDLEHDLFGSRYAVFPIML
jgi:hypothetical protein